MCARYGVQAEYNVLIKHYGLAPSDQIKFSDKTIYPHLGAPVVVKKPGGMKLEIMNYSLVPSWSKVRKPKFATYNARLEDIETKPTWREPFKRRHCLVPMTYFIESCHFGDYAGNLIRIQSDSLMTAAGIFDEWQDPESGEKVRSFAIITTEPSADLLKAGHDRSPLFLSGDVSIKWLQELPKPKVFLLENRVKPHFNFAIEAKLKGFSP